LAGDLQAAMPARFDLIVVGGGINGSGIARDAAIRGLSVLLLEKDDIANATSAWSSRMIHGGIKYLENYEVDLVRESLREREWLLHAAPHLVQPLPFMMPFLRRNRRGPLMLSAGMMAYELLSFDKSLPHHRLLGRSGALKLAPGLDPNQLRGAALFYDAQAENAERLSVENVLSAQEHGAEVRTHTKATRLILEGRAVVGVEFVDQITGVESSARAGITINATGPWVDELLEPVPGHDRPLVGGTKGTHLVVEPFPGAPRDCAMYYEAVQDGRPVLIIPWRGRYLIGSTDIRFHGDPDDARADDSEIEYILSETNLLMPSAGLTRDSVRLAYTGVRPLPYEPKDDVAKITRHHIVRDHAPDVPGLVTIIGGKLTTFRSLAQDAVDLVSKKLGGKRRRCSTRSEQFPGARTADFAAFGRSFRANVDLGNQASERLLALYGTRAPEVIRLARQEAHLDRTIDPASGALAAEVVFAYRTESARTLTDVIMRRTMLGLDPDLSSEAVDDAATILAEHAGWSKARRASELDAYVRYSSRFRLAALDQPVSLSAGGPADRSSRP
jgi:glycerol-3-phosphate dehydrogenase